MSNIIEINQTLYPIISISTSYEKIDGEQVVEYINTMLDLYKQNQNKNIVIIYEISVLKAVDANARIKIGNWLKENSTLIKNAVAGVCYVQKNYLQKIVLDGIFAVQTPQWTHKTVTSLEEGIKWGNEILKNKTN